MAELHVIGSIVGASGFEGQNIFCKWGITAGRSWDLLEGLDKGQTQVDHPEDGEIAVWEHPLDIHYICKGLSGWPKLHFQVWSQDSHGRNDISGYGFCHIPTAAGVYDIDCPTWLPEGSLGERLTGFFVGGHPRLRWEEVVHSPGDRFRLQTVAGGMIHLHLGIVTKDFERHNVHTGS
ncbi:hypothetical protein WJX72_011956 [[Myrmecia] bisecta]|uniref:B9 domain-containing protein 2 n=1 Tax=[Myrmecia] bisecta TaxID=41462 RepID=A0AAW1Q8F3_9CHLO